MKTRLTMKVTLALLLESVLKLRNETSFPLCFQELGWVFQTSSRPWNVKRNRWSCSSSRSTPTRAVGIHIRAESLSANEHETKGRVEDRQESLQYIWLQRILVQKSHWWGYLSALYSSVSGRSRFKRQGTLFFRRARSGHVSSCWHSTRFVCPKLVSGIVREKSYRWILLKASHCFHINLIRSDYDI